MDIEKVFNKILLFDYDNDENVSKFIQQIVPIINEHMKESTKLIDKLTDLKEEIEKVLHNIK